MKVLDTAPRPEIRRGRRDELARTDRRCRRCGYGVATHAEPLCCPMCGGRIWDEARPASPPVL